MGITMKENHVEDNVQSNAHYSLVNQAYIAIYSTDSSDEAMESLTPFYPHYNTFDQSLDSDYDTAFKDAHRDHSPADFADYSLEKKAVNVVKDYPFKVDATPFGGGTAGAIENLTHKSTNG